jgi:hypothetical protein
MRYQITTALLVLLVAGSLHAQPAFDANYERFLIPVFVGQTPGTNGSLFSTSLTPWSKSESETVRIWGLEEHCGAPVICPPPDYTQPVLVKPYGAEGSFFRGPVIIPNGNPGRFIYVPKAEANLFAVTLRAFDESRRLENYGTQLPIVRESDFTNDRIVLPDVPMHPPYRNTLRIYSTYPTRVNVWFEGPDIIGSPTITPQPGLELELRPGLNEFDPAYAQFTKFEQYPYNLAVVVQSPSCPQCTPPLIAAKIWAFITVTNNETQHITTITPQP